MNLKLLRIGFFLLTFSLTTKAKSEIIIVKIFFDKNWVICKSEKALYYRICKWDNDKNFYEGDFEDLLLNNTKIVQGNYTQGKKDGEFIFYYDSGSERIKAFFKDDKPDSLWIYYYPNRQIHYKIVFIEDQFNIVEINNENGISILQKKNDFIFEFQNDILNLKTNIVGTIENGFKVGEWKIINNNITIGYDLYKKGKYIKTVHDYSFQSDSNKRIITNSIFVPFSIYQCERFNFQDDISEIDYPFLYYKLFPWKPIESAIGIVEDSTVSIRRNTYCAGSM